MNTRLTEPGRKTRSEGTSLEVRDGARLEGGAPAASVDPKLKGTGGFRSLGDFALAIRAAARGNIDPRLKALDSSRIFNAAPSTYSQEGVGADGGYLVPPDFRTTILQKVLAEDQLLSRTDQQMTTSSNSITIPVDETTPWQTSGGIQAYWEGEAATYLQSKAALQTVTIRAYKLGALVPVTDEQLEDGPALEAYLRRKTPDKMNFKINDALLNGDGVGKPAAS
jgi:HK97 family phage major capsid protein